ncbi:MAG: hypothetical protein WCO63_02210 [Bacteroidota bacterium]
MKTLAGFLAIFGILLSSCTAVHYVNAPVDDVYNSPPKQITVVKTETKTVTQTQAPQYQQQNIQNQPQQAAVTITSGDQQAAVQQDSVQDTTALQPYYTKSETVYEPNGNVVVTEKSYYGTFDPDNYYDYAYAARINRFQPSPVSNNYYYDYYTNSYYYSNNYDDWGSSIYMGYNWLNPSFGFGFGYGGLSIGFGWGYPSYGYGYPGYGYGYPGYSYGYGFPYYGDYYGGCCGCWNPNSFYYNSYDNNTHYGPRGSGGGRGSNHGSGRTAGKSGDGLRPEGNRSNDMVFGDRYQMAVNRGFSDAARPNTINNNAGSRANTVAPAATVRPNNEGSRTPNAVSGSVKAPAFKGRPLARPQAPNSRVNPANPNQKAMAAPTTPRYAKPKTYSSPNYTKPKSPQEYVSPKTERVPGQGNAVRENTSRQRPIYTAPEQRLKSRESAPVNSDRESGSSGNSYDSRSSGSSGSGYSGGSRSSGGNSSGSSGGNSGGSGSGGSRSTGGRR